MNNAWIRSQFGGPENNGRLADERSRETNVSRRATAGVHAARTHAVCGRHVSDHSLIVVVYNDLF